MAEHVVWELDGNVVKRAERLVNCCKFCVKNIQRNFVVLPEAVVAVVGERAAQAAGAFERMRDAQTEFCMVQTKSVHATCATVRTILLEAWPMRSPAEEQYGSAAVIILGSESGSIKS